MSKIWLERIIPGTEEVEFSYCVGDLGVIELISSKCPEDLAVIQLLKNPDILSVDVRKIRDDKEFIARWRKGTRP